MENNHCPIRERHILRNRNRALSSSMEYPIQPSKWDIFDDIVLSEVDSNAPSLSHILYCKWVPIIP